MIFGESWLLRSGDLDELRTGDLDLLRTGDFDFCFLVLVGILLDLANTVSSLPIGIFSPEGTSLSSSWMNYWTMDCCVFCIPLLTRLISEWFGLCMAVKLSTFWGEPLGNLTPSWLKLRFDSVRMSGSDIWCLLLNPSRAVMLEVVHLELEVEPTPLMASSCSAKLTCLFRLRIFPTLNTSS